MGVPTFDPALEGEQMRLRSGLRYATAGGVVAATALIGFAVVAWTTDGRIVAAVRSTSGTWSKATIVSAAAENATSPAAAVRPDGSVVLVWAARRTSDSVIESSTRVAAGSWGTPRVVSTAGLSAAGPVRVGMDGSGAVLAAWAQTPTPPTRNVMASTLAPGGSWTSPTTLGTPIASAITQVSVAENASGAVVVGWVRIAGDQYGDVVTRRAR